MADTKTLSQQFLEAYLADPEKNPYGQFYQTPYTGSLVGQLPMAYEKYGALSDPLALAQQLRSAGDLRAVRQAGRDLAAQTRQERATNYEAYKQPYTQAQNLFREQRAAGFESPEAEEQARQGLAAVREATFLPYLANRGYLEAQERLQDRAISLARMGSLTDFRKERMQKSGMSPEDIKASLKPFRKMQRRQEERAGLMYGAVKDVGRGGEVELGNRLSLGESLGKMMTDATWAPVEAAWRKENAPQGGYGYGSRPDAGSGSSNVVEAQPRAQEPTTGTGLGGQVAGVASALGEAVRSGAPRLNLGVGGSGDVLNRKDIRAAIESGLSRRDIRQAVKEGDIRMSGKARAQLFRNK